MLSRKLALWFRLLVVAGCGIVPLQAALQVQLASLTDTSQPVGVQSSWQAVATDAVQPQYRFELVDNQGATSLLRDYASYSARLDWTPIEEGTYLVRVTALDPASGETAVATASYQAASRIGADLQPVVSITPHPLVLLYSAPPCEVGWSVRVVFAPADAPNDQQATPLRPCTSDRSTNFYLAGLLPETSYIASQQIVIGTFLVQTGPAITFTSGSLNLTFNSAAALPAPTAQINAPEPLLLDNGGTARNLAGQIVWYQLSSEGPLTSAPVRPVDGGTFLSNTSAVPGYEDKILREYDLVGNVLHETNLDRVQAVLGSNYPRLTSFHHEVLRLPNGYTAALASVEQIFSDVQGLSGPVDLIGSGIVVLDQNWQAVWAWNPFDHLDVNRKAVLGETCMTGQPGCPINVLLAPVAQDWMHANSLWRTDDGNLLMSVRHQDWLLKIDYRDGAGEGTVLWRLGREGDFILEGVPDSETFPWFSHQHDASLVANGLLLYDNGNTRHDEIDPAAQSRGQFYELDEAAHSVRRVLSVDLGHYSSAVGSAQRLSNGYFFFLSGYVLAESGSGPYSIAADVMPVSPPDGAILYQLQINGLDYRAFRLRDLYTYRPVPNPEDDSNAILGTAILRY